MDNVSIVGDQGGQINVNSNFQVSSVDTLTDFTKVRRIERVSFYFLLMSITIHRLFSLMRALNGL